MAFGQNGENTSAMGPVFADFDNDGKVDLFISDSKYNRMYRNLGGLMFDDITQPAGISQLAAQYVSWGSGVQDFDNDGLLDVFITHGGLVHMVPQEHGIFRNAGKGKLWMRRPLPGLSLTPCNRVKTVGRGAAFADYDNDGKMDAFLVNLVDRPSCCTTPRPPPGTGSGFISWAKRVTATASERRSKSSPAASASSANGPPAQAIFPRTTGAFISDWAPPPSSTN